MGLLSFGSGFDNPEKENMMENSFFMNPKPFNFPTMPSPVPVILWFARSEAAMIKKALQEKYNQKDDVCLEALCEMAILRESRHTKVTLVGLDVHKKRDKQTLVLDCDEL